MARPPYCPPVPSLACFIRLILLRSLVLEFSSATPATQIAQDRLFLNICSVGCMSRLPYSPPMPFPAGSTRLILLRIVLLDFPCATQATPIAQDLLFLNVRCAFLPLVEESLIE